MGTKINADDFGISKGVNEAIIKMHQEGNLDSASLMLNFDFTADAVKKAKSSKNLKIGLHFNLTTGKSVLHSISIPLLTNKDGNFKNGFVKLLILSLFCKKKFLSQVEAELKAQIEMIKSFGIEIDHINGHRHIHYIIGIFDLVDKVAKKENINHIRIINESLFQTIKLGFFPPISGIIKLFIIKILGIFNGSKKIISPPYFFSLIHSCKLNNQIYQKFKQQSNYENVEIMVHPSITSFDDKNKIKYESNHLFSKNRDDELNITK